MTWALDEGVVPRGEGENRVVVDVPSGRLETFATVAGGRVRSVRFRNVPAFVWGTGIEAAGRMVDVAYGGAFYAQPRGASRARRAPAPDRARPDAEGGTRGRARHRPSARAGVERRLRRRLLAGGERASAHPAERHGVRRRRGRPLTVRERHVCTPRIARRAGPAPSRRAAPAPVDRRLGVHRAGRGRDGSRQSPGCRHRGRRHRVSHGRARRSTSTRTTRSARGFCCAKGGTTLVLNQHKRCPRSS